MKAKVTHYNSKVVFSLIEPTVLNLDDILAGDIESCGIKMVSNETQGTQTRVNIGEFHKTDEPFRGHSGEAPANMVPKKSA